MHPNPRRILPIVLLLALAGAGYWYFFLRPGATDDGALAASGTIEALTVNVSPELSGRVTAVNAGEGQAVQAGQVLVQFDPTLLEAQRAQAQASLKAVQAQQAAAEAGLAAAQANADLLAAGPSAEQLAVAQTVVDRAQLVLDQAESAYADLAAAAQEGAPGTALLQQIDIAQVNLENAQAQYNLARAGARPEQLDAAQAQVDAARAQRDAAASQAQAAQAALDVLGAQIAKLSVAAPADGVVLSRAIEPGEVASPGAVLLVVGRLDDLTITVFVPEDRYGEVRLGQTASVAVDSYPAETFAAAVTHIADQAEFTPRNVQTATGRKTTVYAVRLSIANPDGRLKPGMPADVTFRP